MAGIAVKRFLLAFIAFVFLGQAYAAEITGRIRDTSGGTARVVIDGDVAPAIGDSAEIFFKLAGDDVEISVGTGRVLKVEGDSVQLKIENATGELARDQLVRINSTNPQPRAAITSASPSLSAPPEQVGKETPTNPPSASVEGARIETITRYAEEAIAKFNAKDYKGAIAIYNKWIEIDPTNFKPYANRGSSYNQLKQSRRALADLNEAIRLNPNLSQLHVIRGNCYADIHQLKRAVDNYDEAIRLDPKDKQPYFNRATVYMELAQVKAAIEDLNQAIALKPTYWEAYGNRAACYKAIGKAELAKRDFARFQELKAGASSGSPVQPAPVSPERKN